jgi:hypothetical protein
MQVSEFVNLMPVNTTDSDKVNEIAASLLSDGWIGCPVVYMRGHLVTGCHRQQAMMSIQSDWGKKDVPAIDLAEVFEEVGLNLAEVMEGEDCQEAWDSSFSYILDALPVEIITKYEIQW